MYFHSLVYLETSAATGQNVARSIESLLERVMIRMENAVDKAMLPGRRGRPRDPNDSDLNSTNTNACSCWYNEKLFQSYKDVILAAKWLYQ